MRGRRKPWAEPYLQAHPELVLGEIDPKSDLFSVSPLSLEIGMGKGDFLLSISQKKPGTFLGLERDLSVLATAAKKFEAEPRPNVRLLGGDFDDWLESLSQLRFDTIYLNFSDPWPKKRHAKRRLTYHERLKAIASLLKEDGQILMKTDNPILYAFTLEEIPLAGLTCLSHTDHYEFDAEVDAMSEYEARFREEGKPIHRIVIAK